MSDELVITRENFNDYFFDIRTSQPKKGQVMARYQAAADFIDGPEKRHVMELLERYDNADMIPKIMRKLVGAREDDSYRVPVEMAKDLLGGMSHEQVAAKPYRFTFEQFYYTMKDCVPNDPHWTIITLMNLDQFLDAKGNLVRIKSEVIDETTASGPEQGDDGSVEVVLQG
jgi:hypothetical protein